MGEQLKQEILTKVPGALVDTVIGEDGKTYFTKCKVSGINFLFLKVDLTSRGRYGYGTEKNPIKPNRQYHWT